MATVPDLTTIRKPPAYYAQYLGLSGVLTKPADRVLFLEPESGAVVTLTAEEVYRDVVLNGEVGETMRQYVADQLAGGPAMIACTRAIEVA